MVCVCQSLQLLKARARTTHMLAQKRHNFDKPAFHRLQLVWWIISEMAAKTELIYLRPSPFSHRAKWALDSAGISFSVRTYSFCTTYICELPLRWHIGKLMGNITAPILLAPCKGGRCEVLMDSTAIARWADEHSTSNPGQLFPKEQMTDIYRWVQAADNLMSLFRREMAAAGLAFPMFREAMLPTGLAGPSSRLARHILRRVFSKLAVKYKDQDETARLDQAVSDLRAARQLLAHNPNKLLLAGHNTITYADIAMATALTKLSELNTKLPHQAAAAASNSSRCEVAAEGPQTMADCMPSLKPLLEEYADLIAWAAETAKQKWPAGAAVGAQ